MRKLRVALIYGGMGREHEISVMGAKNIIGLIDRRRFTVYPVYIDRRGRWHLGGEGGDRLYPMREARGGSLSADGAKQRIDVALPLLHGDFGEDGRVQGALDCAGIPYVGCAVAAGAVAADKILTKKTAEALGIPTAASVFTTNSDTAAARALCEEKIGYPAFIKPSGLGSSVGCSLVGSPEEFGDAFAEARSYGERVLIEEYLDGARELECAYSESSRFGEIFAPPGEVVAKGVYTYRAKYGAGSRAATLPRAELSQATVALARDYSERMVRALGIRQIARIDFFLYGGELLLNEINTMPGFTRSSLYAAMLAECGIELPELLSSLLEDAYDRHL